MIAVEKKALIDETIALETSMDVRPSHKQNNRQCGDLKDDFDFIKVPKVENKPRGDSPSNPF